MSIYETLSKINVNEYTQKKNGLTYLPWAYAWGKLLSVYPKSYYIVCESKNGWNYFTDGRTCWVKTIVTAIDGEDSSMVTEYLPVMDHKNNAIPADQVTSVQVNKAIQRCLTKAIARLGLGLYIYAGEDLPEEMSAEPAEAGKPAQASKPPVVKISSTVKPEPERKSRAVIVRETCAKLRITEEQFGLCKKMACWADVIPDVKTSELSDDEFIALLDFVSHNYQLSLQSPELTEASA